MGISVTAEVRHLALKDNGQAHGSLYAPQLKLTAAAVTPIMQYRLLAK